MRRKQFAASRGRLGETSPSGDLPARRLAGRTRPADTSLLDLARVMAI